MLALSIAPSGPANIPEPMMQTRTSPRSRTIPCAGNAIGCDAAPPCSWSEAQAMDWSRSQSPVLRTKPVNEPGVALTAALHSPCSRRSSPGRDRRARGRAATPGPPAAAPVDARRRRCQARPGVCSNLRLWLTRPGWAAVVSDNVPSAAYRLRARRTSEMPSQGVTGMRAYWFLERSKCYLITHDPQPV